LTKPGFIDIEESGVRLRLTVVDTPGYGDFVNNDESWKPIEHNIEGMSPALLRNAHTKLIFFTSPARFDAYLEQENRVNRSKMVDNRVHACIYFIEPTGHS
jgi:septin 7